MIMYLSRLIHIKFAQSITKNVAPYTFVQTLPEIEKYANKKSCLPGEAAF